MHSRATGGAISDEMKEPACDVHPFSSREARLFHRGCRSIERIPINPLCQRLECHIRAPSWRLQGEMPRNDKKPPLGIRIGLQREGESIRIRADPPRLEAAKRHRPRLLQHHGKLRTAAPEAFLVKMRRLFPHALRAIGPQDALRPLPPIGARSERESAGEYPTAADHAPV
jgi:hypothetical protein